MRRSIFRIKIEFRDKVQWEKLTRPSPMEKMASEIAGATLLDQRNYMDELEHIISHERTYGYHQECSRKHNLK